MSQRRQGKIRCPNCGHMGSGVDHCPRDPWDRGGARRRKCKECRWSYYTIEQVDPLRKPKPPKVLGRKT